MRKAIKVPSIEGKVVDIYRNLHLPGVMYSVRLRETGRVIGHSDSIHLTNCEFRVNAKVRDRVRKLRRKEVHALIRGTVVGTDIGVFHASPSDNWIDVCYNPYKWDHFVDSTGRSLASAAFVYLDGTGVRARL